MTAEEFSCGDRNSSKYVKTTGSPTILLSNLTVLPFCPWISTAVGNGASVIRAISDHGINTSRLNRRCLSAPRQQLSPPPYREILAQRALWGATLGHFCQLIGLYFVLSWMQRCLHSCIARCDRGRLRLGARNRARRTRDLEQPLREKAVPLCESVLGCLADQLGRCGSKRRDLTRHQRQTEERRAIFWSNCDGCLAH